MSSTSPSAPTSSQITTAPKFNGTLLTAYTPQKDAWYVLQVIWQLAPPAGRRFSMDQMHLEAPQMTVAFNVPNDGKAGRPNTGGASDWYTSQRVDLMNAASLAEPNSPSPPRWIPVPASSKNSSALSPYLGQSKPQQFRLSLEGGNLLMFAGSSSQTPILQVPTMLTPTTEICLISAAMFQVPANFSSTPWLTSFLTLPESVALCRVCPNEDNLARQCREKWQPWVVMLSLLLIALLIYVLFMASDHRQTRKLSSSPRVQYYYVPPPTSSSVSMASGFYSNNPPLNVLTT